MPLELSAAQVQALAPDASSVAAGKKLAKPTSWKTLGQSSAAVWGECQGSALYRTQVALVDFASKCTCPSRKFPCKHALGLLFLAADAKAAFAPAAPPEWVTSWLEKRVAAQDKKQARADAAADKPVDEVAQAKRAAKRHDNVLSGIDQLDAWMNDVIRQGLARVQSESGSFWELQARRMVDAQAPGLASRVRRIGERVGGGEHWARRALHELGSTALLTHAYRRLEQLEPSLAADVRRLVGFSLDQTEVLAHGDIVDDEWSVLAEVTRDEERVRMQRAWLRGDASGRTAMVLQFAAGTAATFPETLLAATRFRASLAFWPSACPQRALIVSRAQQPEQLRGEPAGVGIAHNLDRFAEMLGRLPWLDRDLFVLGAVVPVQIESGYAVVDHSNHALRLEGSEHDVLLALSGGHPLTVIGEWNGYGLWPLQAWSRGRLVSLARSAA
jgi:hypothetical protein